MTEGRQRLRPSDRLRKHADFQACYRDGKKRHGRLVILFLRRNGTAQPRFGVTVTRKSGGSVERHRLKRVLKEGFRLAQQRAALGGVDVVVHVRAGTHAEDAEAARRELETLLPWG